MKFIYKIAAASSALLLITTAFLNTTQYINVKRKLPPSKENYHTKQQTQRTLFTTHQLLNKYFRIITML